MANCLFVAGIAHLLLGLGNFCHFLFLHVCFHCFFFFSSRRRHTRSLCDWSSDVCSSDLPSGAGSAPPTSFVGARTGGPLILAPCAPRSAWSTSATSRPGNAKRRFAQSREESLAGLLSMIMRSEERRVGKECWCRWARYRE